LPAANQVRPSQSEKYGEGQIVGLRGAGAF
jgi:hypothetical protein